jgi:hypothetical protein
MRFVKLLGKSMINSMGFEIRRKNRLVVDMERELGSVMRIVHSHTMLPDDRLQSLWRQAIHCEQTPIPGQFVECGVWKGGAVAVMCLANLRHGLQRRHVHLFDAFTDICEPDADLDGERAVKEVEKWAEVPGKGGRLRPLTGIYRSIGGPGSIEENKRLLEDILKYDREFLHYHVGWFQDTLPALNSDDVGPIAILRIDADWYHSTKLCLEFLFDKVVQGGFVIIDDYGYYPGCKKAVDEFVRDNISPVPFLHAIDSSGIYWIKE